MKVFRACGMKMEPNFSIGMETVDHGHISRPRRVAHRRDLTYQFPVYRWLSWLVVAGFAAGLALMYLVAGMFGIPAPLGWAFLVVVFCAGIALLERPKALLAAMMFYFLLMPGNRLLGLMGLPLPGFIDELFFVPFLAVIVMTLIQRADKPSGLWFPAAFMGVAALSWYVNGKPSAFTTVRVTLVLLKSFIIWYYCRMTCTFKTVSDFWKWGLLYIHYAALHFLYNCLWQGRPWVTRHWDNSGGLFGPDGSGAAHFVGYISILALFLLAAWWFTEGRRATKRMKAWMLFLGIVLVYDLAFMTDTKHALLIMPAAFLPILFHQSIPRRVRMGLLFGGTIVTALGIWYVVASTGTYQFANFATQMLDSPKGEAYRAVTADFPFLVHYPVLGAGPGRFFSQQAVDSGAPLARRYVIPYRDEDARAALTHRATNRTGGSLLRAPTADVLILMGEFGWLGAVLYAIFLLWILASLWRKASRSSALGLVYLALSAGLLFLCATMLFAPIGTVHSVVFPWWMLMGRVWDMRVPGGRDGDALPSAESTPAFPADDSVPSQA